MTPRPYRDRQGAAPTGDGYPLGYLISFRCYGTWLHGDARGSIDREHNAPGEPLLGPDRDLQAYRECLLRHAPVNLDARRRGIVDRTIREVCRHRGWFLHALNVRSNHVHVAVSAACRPEQAMTAFKSWSTRRLREAQLVSSKTKTWSRHGSTRYLWSSKDLEDARLYVEEGQGNDLPRHEPLPDGRGTGRDRHHLPESDLEPA